MATGGQHRQTPLEAAGVLVRSPGVGRSEKESKQTKKKDEDEKKCTGARVHLCCKRGRAAKNLQFSFFSVQVLGDR